MLYSILSCVSLDYYIPNIFEEFCAEFGYDTDSRKAFDTWQACLIQSNKLRKVFSEDEISALPRYSSFIIREVDMVYIYRVYDYQGRHIDTFISDAKMSDIDMMDEILTDESFELSDTIKFEGTLATVGAL